ncbi:hypothetical protein BDV27DRAFT_154392 [Aspergillus caelatus]|uniref:Zn(2)-C6 fungal-type domain-containing protein n=1 Tax=Aspergillus caelatus TaxID=61420 RepID=A0A5N7ADX8_9EURO|nr:uncharacterized protein BDV27DRAFT_154392 [Aspergillus caelatus]KAE8368064.1 hypothetical protein BDV27DRAFT_154392 [Aspergillus caelatus]
MDNLDATERDPFSNYIESLVSRPACSTQHAGVGATFSKGLGTTQNPRKQNHSCDLCRTAKRACSLRQNIPVNGQKPTTPWKTCDMRGLECTVTWLANRKSQQETRKQCRTTCYVQGTGTVAEPHVAPFPEERAETLLVELGAVILLREDELARQLAGRDTLSQRFN